MAQTTALKPDVMNVINHYKELLRQKGIGFDKIYAFGSQVTGKSKPWSDIDLCIVSADFATDRHQALVDLLQARDDETLDIEPHPLHPTDFDDKYDTLAQEIKQFGVAI